MPVQMTEEERNLVKLKWDMAFKDILQQSSDIFLSFFEEHPVYKTYFHQFKEESLETLRNNPKLRAHGNGVIRELSQIIEHINHQGKFLEVSRQLAEQHYPRGVRPSQYRELLAVVGDFLRQQLGGVFDERAQAAWDSFISYLVSTIREVMDKYDAVHEENESDSNNST